MERFKLNVLTLIPKQIHHHLEISLISNISCHDTEIRSIEKDLSEKLQRLSLRDVVVGEYESCERGKKLGENESSDIVYVRINLPDHNSCQDTRRPWVCAVSMSPSDSQMHHRICRKLLFQYNEEIYRT